MKSRAMAAVLLLLSISTGWSQAKKIDQIKETTKAFIQEEQENDSKSIVPPINKSNKPEVSIIPDPPGMLVNDDAVRSRYLASMREYYEYRISGFQHRRRVFEWQLYSSKITFYVVVVLVLAGIYFSGVQFHVSLKPRKLSKKDMPAVSTEMHPLETQLEASLKGIKISSPVLGVIILIISFLFFYLYLVHIYPISEMI
jgi:hypothetical protein